MNLANHLMQQYEFSQKTFGPGERVAGVIDHIRKELVEVEGHPNDLEEWVDVMLLAFDGALRQDYTPNEICLALTAKLEKNKRRDWPDWRTADRDKGIEHIREEHKT